VNRCNGSQHLTGLWQIDLLAPCPEATDAEDAGGDVLVASDQLVSLS